MEDKGEVTVSSTCFQKFAHKKEEIDYYLKRDKGLRKVAVIFKSRKTGHCLSETGRI